MTYEQVKKNAELFRISPKEAVAMRISFLESQMNEAGTQVEEWVGIALEREGVDFHVAANGVYQALADFVKAAREIRNLKTGMRGRKFENEITDDMVEYARQYPVNLLVDFKRGKAEAFCHDDRHPSMFYGDRSNRAVCPVCDKKFGPIDILMDRDGMTFHDAVRQLCTR